MPLGQTSEAVILSGRPGNSSHTRHRPRNCISGNNGPFSTNNHGKRSSSHGTSKNSKNDHSNTSNNGDSKIRKHQSPLESRTPASPTASPVRSGGPVCPRLKTSRARMRRFRVSGLGIDSNSESGLREPLSNPPQTTRNPR